MLCQRLPSLLVFCGLAVALASADQTLKLSSGHDMPIIGLGTWLAKPEDTDAAVTAALEYGYRHFDTAYDYDNEDAIGESLKKWFAKGNKREDVFITTKLPPFTPDGKDVEKYLNISLQRLQLDYVDMYLVHYPWGYQYSDPFHPWVQDDSLAIPDLTTDHIAIWKAMEAQVKAGRAKSIGLANFNESQVLRILNNAEIKPSNLQVEMQMYNQQKPLRKFCAEHNIAITSHGTLGSFDGSEVAHNKSIPRIMEHPVVVKIAKAHKKTPAQVLLRHAMQNGVIIIPKSIKSHRIKENHDVFDFELTDEELKEMNNVDMGEDGRFSEFFTFRGATDHPEYPWTYHLKKLREKTKFIN